MARRELQKRHTFAAPVEINGIRGNMAAVVQLTGKNHYHTHRIIMPDGSAFVFNAEKNTESKPAGAANLRVALLQPTAYVRAAAVLDYKYLATAFGDRMGTRQATAEMLEHSGIALWKNMGFFDTDVGRSIRDQIKGKGSKLEDLVDKSMAAAELENGGAGLSGICGVGAGGGCGGVPGGRPAGR